ncbi:MAG: SPOR domain-containing protein [Nitrosomonas sp.]|nr:SPOR domain-containing protein [Nitrosomonas sp.]
MNKNITEEELLLRKRARRRLVGAIVLVLAAVIILPMIFDEPKPDTEAYEIDIHLSPDEDVAAISPLVVPPENVLNERLPEVIDPMEFTTDEPLDMSDILQSQDAPDVAIRDSDNINKTGIPIPGIKPRYEMVRSTPNDNAGVSTTTPVLKDNLQTTDQQSGGYVVQLGAFSNPTKAQQQQNALISNGFKAYTETLVINGQVMTRVRLGPFANRSAAQAELDKLRRLGQDGVITQQ